MQNFFLFFLLSVSSFALEARQLLLGPSENSSEKIQEALIEMQPGDVFKTYAEIKKSSKMLEFKPKVPLQIGLKRTIDWYKSFIGFK